MYINKKCHGKEGFSPRHNAIKIYMIGLKYSRVHHDFNDIMMTMINVMM